MNKALSVLLTADDQAYLEALVLVTCAWLAIRFCFKPIASWDLRVKKPNAFPPGTALEYRIRIALESAGKWLPNENHCLSNALAGKVMLARRRFPSPIHLGVGHKGTGGLRAHAWLEAGGGVIIGEHSIDTVTLIRR